MTDNTADTDANAGQGTERPPPEGRERRRDSGTGKQPAAESEARRCAEAGSGGKAVDGEECSRVGDGDDGDSDGDGGAGADTDCDGSAADDPDSTERCLHWLKLWRVVLLVVLAIVRLIRAL